jgi:hypothetical protein
MSPKKYADDYVTIVTMDEKGNEKRETVYRGEYYEVSLDEPGLIRLKRGGVLLLGVTFALHVGTGFINNPGMYQMYVAIPYAIAFFPMLYTAEGILRLPREKRPYRRDEVGLSFHRIRIAGVMLLIFLAAGILGEAAYLIFAPGSNIMEEYLFLLLEILAAAVATLLQVFRIRSKIKVLRGGEKGL